MGIRQILNFVLTVGLGAYAAQSVSAVDSDARMTPHFAPPGSFVDCESEPRCTIVIHVISMPPFWVFDKDGKSSGPFYCQTFVDYATAHVHPDNNKVVWRLQKAQEGDAATYTFTETQTVNAIELTDPSKYTHPAIDDPDTGMRYVWHTVSNQKKNQTSYQIHVLRTDNDPKLTGPCQPSDPIIANDS